MLGLGWIDGVCVCVCVYGVISCLLTRDLMRCESKRQGKKKKEDKKILHVDDGRWNSAVPILKSIIWVV